MKRKKKYPKLKTDDVHYGDRLQTFNVRCALETAFYVLVKAHNAEEAEVVAETWCYAQDKEQPNGQFWGSETAHKHTTFEAEET